MGSVFATKTFHEKVCWILKHEAVKILFKMKTKVLHSLWLSNFKRLKEVNMMNYTGDYSVKNRWELISVIHEKLDQLAKGH